MKNKKFSKRAVLTSIVVVILCCALLIGNTFAWFTDTEATAINTIKSGKLDVAVYYALQSDVTADGTIPDTAWKHIDETTPVFNQDALWEPGYTEIVYFKLVNEGNLALEYEMHVDIVKEESGLNVDGHVFTLSKYIEAYVNNAPAGWGFRPVTSREIATENPPFAPPVWHDTLHNAANYQVCYPDNSPEPTSLDSWQWLEPGEEYYSTLVLWMPKEVGNEANYGEKQPWIQLGINFTATQYNWTKEPDSFDHNYDADATVPEYVYEPTISDGGEPEEIVIDDVTHPDGNVSFTGPLNGNIDVRKDLHMTFEGVKGDVQIVINEGANHTIIMQDCEFTLGEGEMLVNAISSNTTWVYFKNVKINGVEMNNTLMANYVSSNVTPDQFN